MDKLEQLRANERVRTTVEYPDPYSKPFYRPVVSPLADAELLREIAEWITETGNCLVGFDYQLDKSSVDGSPLTRIWVIFYEPGQVGQGMNKAIVK